MGSNEPGYTRRNLLRAGTAGAVVLTAGCVGPLTDADDRPTPGAVSDAEFAFDYAAQSGRLSIEYRGGGQVFAGDLTVQSTAGREVAWAQLGSTAASPDEPLEPGDTATLGADVLNWERAVTTSETVRLVYLIDDAPTTLARFTPEADPTETATEEPTASPLSEEDFADGFEDGARDGWSVIRSPTVDEWSGNNDWSVTTDAISGSYSLHVESNGDASANIIATDERVVDLSRDFTFSYAWHTTDPSNRGPHVSLFDADGTAFRDEGIARYRPEDGIGIHYGGDAIDPDGSPYSENPIRFGGTELPGGPLEADTAHVTRVEKRGTEATLLVDGEEYGSTSVTDTGGYRLALSTAGTWGSPSSMTWDAIRIVHR
jgi:hypothetical protein